MDTVIVSDLKTFSFRRVAGDLSRVLNIPYYDWREYGETPKNIIITGACYHSTLNYAVKYGGKTNIILYLTIEGKPLIDFTLRHSINKYTTIIPVSKYVKEKMEEAGLKSCDPIPHGIELNPEVDTSFINSIYEEIPKNTKVLLNISRNDLRKGLDKLLITYKYIQHAFGEETYLILHSSSEGAYKIRNLAGLLQLKNFWFTDLARERGLTNQQINALYSIAYLYLCSSLSEGFGLFILESLRFGVPIVAPALPPIDEIIGESKAGLLIPIQEPYKVTYMDYVEFEMFEYDIDHLIDATTMIIINENLRKQMSKEAVEIAKKYDMYKVYQKFREYLK